MRVEPYVFITDITTAHYGCVIISREGFVVHAVIKLLKISGKIPTTPEQAAIAAAVE